MLAGEPPFTGPTAQAMIARRLSEPPPSVRRTRPNVPETVDQAIQRALAPVAADRFESAAELARALQVPSATQAPETAERRTGGTADGSGDRRIAAAQEPTPAVPPFRRGAVILLAGFLLGLGVLFAWRHSLDGGSAASTGGPRVLAVLPFENLGDSTTEYFADGITDAVRGKLSSLPGLQVIASTSSNEYKGSGKPLPVIARELEADYLLIARIRWAKAADGSSRVKVSPELVDVGRGGAPKVKWQQPFDAEITDVFTVQADIADQVADALDLALGTGQKQTLTERPTANLEAYDAFLKGEASGGLTIADAPTLRNAINYYEQAVALDSTFAVAWAALGRAQGQYYYNVTPTPRLRRGREERGRSEPRPGPRPARGMAGAVRVLPERPRGLRAVARCLRQGTRADAGKRRPAHRGRALGAGPRPLGRGVAEPGERPEAGPAIGPDGAAAGPHPGPAAAVPRGDRGGRSRPRRVTRQPRPDREQGHGLPRLRVTSRARAA